MDAHAHHHEMPTEGRELTGLAVSATLHCLTGCAIGEVTGMAVGTALGFSNLGTIALAVGLAFLFGYALTSLPLLRAGLAFGVVIPIALASDTLSIATMEIVDNAIMLIVPGAMESGLGDVLFWGALSFALAIAFVVTVPVNRWLLARGKGHTAVHETGIHGGPPTRVVGAATALAFAFGAIVLAGEALGEDEPAHGAPHETEMPMTTEAAHRGGEEDPMTTQVDQVRGTEIAAGDLRLKLESSDAPSNETTVLGFTISDRIGTPIEEFDVEHERRMHLIIARRDLTGFQHLHPEMDAEGRWSVPVRFRDAGSYRVFADFNHNGESLTLGADLNVDGSVSWRELPDPEALSAAGDGYEVNVARGGSKPGVPSALEFEVTRAGKAVKVEPYLGANGHLVALREGDLAFLHVHPAGHGSSESEESAIRFEATFPTEGRYRLFLQFKHGGQVRTAEFTKVVAE